ncbi:Co2+/Mg2+ efflux protein ApaG [Chitinilyticum litopenaei]|uniref:Co2+/Mg2+ efflux protein ApaG n=1 Tax=Chitinilyticum litopenaei TaxID=1121276 RepID=UPI0004092140|nr:Co2+/Mg2+ efflux protein ApaG [Chitinilyticum litopenaei]
MSSRFPIAISVQARFVPEQSDLVANHYVFAYHITIRNEADVPVQLLSRHWLIADMNGRVQEVRGEGVVGEQPRLQPGQSFEYTSGVNLNVPLGTMRGSYRFVTADGEEFDAPIPEFMLTVPRTLH